MFPAEFNLSELLETNGGDGSQGFVVYGSDHNSYKERSGKSVSNAGDVNGDGIDDIIIGIDEYYWYNDVKGRSYVIFGDSSIGAEIKLSDIINGDGSKGFVVNGIDHFDESGQSVSSAGDVNGDGIDDIIIGAPDTDGYDNTGSGSGESYVVFGSSSFDAEVELSNIVNGDGSKGFVVYGIDNFDYLGYSVSNAGDVNGDGINDIVIGARGGDGENNNTFSGESYVVFGSSSFDVEVNLSNIVNGDGSDGFVVYGIDFGDLSGRSVSNAGDVNGDGIDDIIIGASIADGDNNNTEDSGESYVVFGSSSFDAKLNLSTLDGSNGFVIHGIELDDASGQSVSSAGDVNGDGIDDIIIGANYADGDNNATENSGESYIVFGSSSFDAKLNLSTLDGNNGFVLNGIDKDDFSGYSVSNAGDVNGDGIDDIIIGTLVDHGNRFNTSASGESYIVFGSSSFDAKLNLSTLDGNNGFVLNGIDEGDFFGRSVSGAGDVNGDGIDDIIVGAMFANGYNNTSDESGESYVVFGKADPNNENRIVGTAQNDLIDGGTGKDTIAGQEGDDTINGGIDDDSLNGNAGNDSISGGPGDDELLGNKGNDKIFGDNGNDTIKGGPGDDKLLGNKGNDKIFGDNGNDTIKGGTGDDRLLGNKGNDLLNGNEGNDTINGNDGNDNIDGGKDNDLLVGSTGKDTIVGGNGNDRLYGQEDLDVLRGGAGDDTVSGGAGNDTLLGRSGNDAIDGGGGDDIIFGESNRDDLSKASKDFNLSDLLSSNGGDGTEGFLISAVNNSKDSAWSISGAGDINGDGFDDIIIGAYQYSYVGSRSGKSYVIFGNSSANAEFSLSEIANSNSKKGFVLNGIEQGDHSGRSVSSAGDFNGDGFDDIIISATDADGKNNSKRNSGESYVVFGGNSFGTKLNLANLDGKNGLVLYGIDAEDYSGRSVSSAGDLNNDGFDDIVIGTPGSDGYNNATTSSGESYVVFGGNSFGTKLNLANLDGSNGFVLNGIDKYDTSGMAVSNAGDLNNDGFDDIIIGASWAYGKNNANYSSGESYVVFGGSSFDAELNLADLDGNNGFVLYGIDEDDDSGKSISNAGDLNGDGYDDVIISAPWSDGYNNTTNSSGESYVVFGSSSFDAELNLADLNGNNGFVLYGDRGDRSGTSVSGAGDVNGDGFDDIIIGASHANGYKNKTENAGESYIVYGSSSFTAEFKLSDLDGINGYVLNGIEEGDNSGTSVSSAGDVNGDGLDDIIIGIDSRTSYFPVVYSYVAKNSGESYVVFGRTEPRSVERDLDATQDDLINGGAGKDTISGNDGNDTINGGADNDRINGNHGNDRLLGARGDDLLDGGAGNDTINGDDGNDTINGGADDDLLVGSKGNDSLTGGNGNDRLYGQEDLDVLRGGAGDDTIGGGAGDDTLFGRSGNDAIDGGSGDDKLRGNEGKDIIFGADGNDTINGGAGDDTINGNDGNDTINGGADEDLLVGSKGNDSLTGGNGNDRLYGQEDLDVLRGGAGDDTIGGGAGDDTINGNEGNDTIDGGADEDLLVGSKGNDSLTGGNGSDRLYGQNDLDFLDGGAGDDLVHGGAGNDTLLGSDGNDTIKGGNGDDYISGGMGRDALLGKAGNDIFEIQLDSINDVIIDFEDGIDRLQLGSGLSFTDLNFLSVNGHTIVRDSSNQVLSVIQNIDSSLITQEDFT